MPTLRLTPSTYAVSSSTYLSVSNAANMYTDTDSDTYATVTNSQTGTTSYYLYIRGFDFSQIPSNVIVSDWRVLLKARESGISTSSSYAPKLCHGTSQITSTMSAISTTATVQEFTGVGIDLDEAIEYGSDFGIRINCRRSSRNTTGYVYVYGAEIEITYTIPVYHDISFTNNTSIAAAISDTHPMEGDDVSISLSSIDGIAIFDNDLDVTSLCVYGSSDSISAVPESDIDTGFSASGANFYMSSSSTGTTYFEYACGHSAENPGSTGSNNTYVKDGGDNTAIGWVIFSFDFSAIPVGATIDSVTVRCYGARESDTTDSTHVARIGVYSGTTLKGTEQNFTSTSNSIVTLTDVGTWTRDELQSAKLHFSVGYYGGRIMGITWIVNYTVDSYVYTIAQVSSDHVIVIDYISTGPTLYINQNGSWVQVTKGYIKTAGTWVLTDLDKLFDNQHKYVRG